MNGPYADLQDEHANLQRLACRRKGSGDPLCPVCEWATRRRRSEAASKQQLQRIPSAKTIAHLMIIKLIA